MGILDKQLASQDRASSLHPFVPLIFKHHYTHSYNSTGINNQVSIQLSAKGLWPRYANSGQRLALQMVLQMVLLNKRGLI
ncbi:MULTISPECIES: hypothetical protein [Moorena]|nr:MULTISPECIES: hypothetical protein [Moorena]NEO14023.1 hypothetical protein [Moorena sp. SIO3E8]NEP27139.1 hypothetical protein [Moorena sp. SIO3I6]